MIDNSKKLIKEKLKFEDFLSLKKNIYKINPELAKTYDDVTIEDLDIKFTALQMVSLSAIDSIIDNYLAKLKNPEKIFVSFDFENSVYVVVDNEGGEAFTENFVSKEATILYILGEDLDIVYEVDNELK